MRVSVKQYVKSLFDLSSQDNQLDRIIAALEKLSADFLLLKNFLENPAYSLEKKKKILSEENIQQKVINFLFILTKNRDLDKIKNIINALKQLRNQQTNSVEMEVQTASVLSGQDLQMLKKSLANKLNKKIILSVSKNPCLLGGIILKIGDTMIDNSLKNKLNILKNELVK